MAARMALQMLRITPSLNNSKQRMQNQPTSKISNSNKRPYSTQLKPQQNNKEMK